MNLSAPILITLALIEPIPLHPLEEWHDHWELLPMTPRLIQMTAGSATHTAGVPQYDGGSDLVRGYSDALYYGETAGNEDIFRSGTAIAFTDSQGSSGSDRMLAAMARTFPIDWRAIMLQAGGAPFYMTRSGSPSQYAYGSGWHRGDTALSGSGGGSNDFADLDAMWAGNGFTDPSEFMMPFMMVNEPPANIAFSFNATDSDDPENEWYNEDGNFFAADGVDVRYRYPVLHGGSTDLGAATELLGRVSHWNSAGSIVHIETDLTLPASGTAAHTFGSSNGSAQISMLETDTLDFGESGTYWMPAGSLRERGSTSFSGKSIIHGHGYITMWDTDADAPAAGGFALPLIAHASGRNPEAFIPGADNGSSNLHSFGSTAAGRYWLWSNYLDPDTLIYSFGHNASTRDITAEQGKAASVFQADLFDLIYQHCYDHLTLYGRYPRIRIVIPWAGSYMDQDRHDDAIGVVDALIAAGIRNTGAIDLYNYWGGEDFVDSAAPADWKAATSFALDGSVHPDTAQDARAAWYAMWLCMKHGAERARDRDRTLDRGKR